jgi:hypothetical protein
MGLQGPDFYDDEGVFEKYLAQRDRAWQGQGLRQDWIVDNYFESKPSLFTS